MALFTINRYDGQEEQSEEIDTEEKSKQMLDKLLKKVEKRKRAREETKLKKAFGKPKKQKETSNQKNETVISVAEQPEPEKPYQEENVDKEEFPFQIIGTDKFSKKQTVKRVLPKWLTNPIKVSPTLADLNTRIDDINNIDEEFREILKSEGHEYYFPIQEAVIPYIIKQQLKPAPLWPRDVCISAPTGSGKTLAFVLPIVHILKTRIIRKIRALVVLPVNELAEQVFNVFKKFVRKTDLKVMLLSGLFSFKTEQKRLVKQIDENNFVDSVDIIVATPGRLVDHIYSTKGLSFKNLKFLVLDEADRMLDREQNDWIFHFEQHLHKENAQFRCGKLNLYTMERVQPPPQKILASATLTHDPEKLHRVGLFNPTLFTVLSETNDSEEHDDNVSSFVIPIELIQNYVICDLEVKPLALYHLIASKQMKRVLCFTGSGLEAHRLSKLLSILSEKKLVVQELSSVLSNKERMDTLKKFASGEIEILVSTDALARGLDITNVDYVISYNTPKHIQTYVHRIGRTARAGRSGSSITLVTGDQLKHFLKLFKKIPNNNLTQLEIEKSNLDVLQDKYINALEKLTKTIQTEQKIERKKIKNIKNTKTKIKFKTKVKKPTNE